MTIDRRQTTPSSAISPAQSSAGGGSIFFGPGSTAGNATFTNQGAGANGAGAGEVRFLVGSNGGNATLINKGGTVSGAAGGVTVFDGGTEGVFTTSVANATLVARGGLNGGLGGVISFLGRTHTGGEARVKLFGNGTMLIDEHHPPGVTVGSIEGDGIIVLGANNLTVGGNKMSTTFSGVIKDGPNGPGGSLTKVGNKMLTLTSANTYSGGTTIKRGALFIANTSGSATGPGPVLISNSALEGNGTIAGAVTVENGLIIPFDTEGSPVIRIRSSLTFNPISDYEWELDRSTGTAAQITCRGVTINENVTFSLIDPDSGILATGTVFTAINNTSASPIVGNFTNLPDGSTFTSKGNTFLVSLYRRRWQRPNPDSRALSGPNSWSKFVTTLVFFACELVRNNAFSPKHLSDVPENRLKREDLETPTDAGGLAMQSGLCNRCHARRGGARFELTIPPQRLARTLLPREWTRTVMMALD